MSYAIPSTFLVIQLFPSKSIYIYIFQINKNPFPKYVCSELHYTFCSCVPTCSIGTVNNALYITRI